MTDRITKINEGLRFHYWELRDISEKRGYDFDIVLVSLQGSQNYNTDHEGSDIDTKTVVIPSFRSIARRENIKLDLDLPNGEKSSIKTFDNYIDLFFKGNINAIEMLYTDFNLFRDHSFSKFFEHVKSYRDEIVGCTRGTIYQACRGMMMNKYKSLYKGTATTQPFVEKYGYDGKDFIHIDRLESFLVRFSYEHNDFSKSLNYGDDQDNIDFVHDVRNGVYAIEQVEKDVEYCMKSVESLKDSFENDEYKMHLLHSKLKDDYYEFLERRILKGE